MKESHRLCLRVLVRVSSDPSVDVSAIGIGDMFDQVEENESLKSIACQRDGRVQGMRRFADLVAEEFIDKIEAVLCPGTLIASTHIMDKKDCEKLFSFPLTSFLFFISDPIIVCPDLPCKSGNILKYCPDSQAFRQCVNMLQRKCLSDCQAASDSRKTCQILYLSEPDKQIFMIQHTCTVL